MTRKWHSHTLQTNPPHREEETQNINSHITVRRQLKASNQPFLSQRYDWKTRTLSIELHNKRRTKLKTPTHT